MFSFQGKAWTGSGDLEKEKLENCNANSYFKTSNWQKSTTETVENFSAFVSAFSYNLQNELGIPIGIIDNSIGGFTSQSWINRENMEPNHQTMDLLNNTHFNPMVQTWVNECKAENFNIKGVIWYKGESNAERPNFHSLLFKTVVSDWQIHWKKPNMPFYYVQLSSLNRLRGEFRDSKYRYGGFIRCW